MATAYSTVYIPCHKSPWQFYAEIVYENLPKTTVAYTVVSRYFNTIIKRASLLEIHGLITLMNVRTYTGWPKKNRHSVNWVVQYSV